MPRPRSWTDDELRAAVADAGTIAEVVRRLRLRHGGAAYVTVRTRMEQLELGLASNAERTAGRTTLPLGEARGGGRARRWSDADLVSAVAAARSLADTFRRLGLSVGGAQWQLVRQRILDLELPTSHWRSPLRPPRSQVSFAAVLDRLKNVDLVAVANSAPSRAAALRALGIPVTQASYRAIARALAEQGVDLDGRAKGGVPRRPLEQILVRGSDWTKTAVLRERLIQAELKERRCERCGIETWCGHPAPLQLDHINGDRRDNRLVNLRILCANCHALTDTWCARNRGRGPGS